MDEFVSRSGRASRRRQTSLTYSSCANVAGAEDDELFYWKLAIALR
jgi:hypothetical protein